MKKMLKIIAMLLVIATVVFAAGCAGKDEAKNTTEPSVAGDHASEGKDKVVVEPGNESGEPGNVSDELGNVSDEPGNVSGEPGNESGEPGNESGEPGNESGEPGNSS